MHKTLLQFAEQENTPNDTTSTEDTESRVVNNLELVQEINDETNDSIRVDKSINDQWRNIPIKHTRIATSQQ